MNTQRYCGLLASELVVVQWIHEGTISRDPATVQNVGSIYLPRVERVMREIARYRCNDAKGDDGSLFVRGMLRELSRHRKAIRRYLREVQA